MTVTLEVQRASMHSGGVFDIGIFDGEKQVGAVGNGRMISIKVRKAANLRFSHPGCIGNTFFNVAQNLPASRAGENEPLRQKTSRIQLFIQMEGASVSILNRDTSGWTKSQDACCLLL